MTAKCKSNGLLVLMLITTCTIVHADEIHSSNWRVTSSHNSKDANHAIDSNEWSRWTTKKPQVPGQTFTIDLIEPAGVNQLVLNSARSPQDYPRAYRIDTSGNGSDWDRAITTGVGNPQGDTVINFPPITTRFIRIIQTGRDSHYWWSIHELEIHLTGDNSQHSKPASLTAKVVDTPTDEQSRISKRWKPYKSWRDSYSVDGICYCDSSNYDHGIGAVLIDTPDGRQRTVVQICNDIKTTYGTGRVSDRIPYNTIACGNAPANNAPDEDLKTGCPGRVDQGSSGCFQIGPPWPLDALYGK
ncbi:hypothetical protein AB833_21585 [Chromatiales bacterium (ex Bugula neritina AB1)]|nr:hypothetical protein AB833_21585 [Chromatiales bacterium (ex Bugula neritina AB1)]